VRNLEPLLRVDAATVDALEIPRCAWDDIRNVDAAARYGAFVPFKNRSIS
jgi:hypothetical protein